MAENSKVKFLKKLNAFRQEAIQLDWKDDGKVMSTKMSYGYLSADKFKKQISPLLVKHGLELCVNFTNLMKYGSNEMAMTHFTLCLEATLIDIDTGEELTSKVLGEGVDSGDKAIAKAQTSAYKQWLSSYLMVADGIDPDREQGDMNYSSQSRAEKEVMRSKVLEGAVPVSKPVEAPKVINTTPSTSEASKVSETPAKPKTIEIPKAPATKITPVPEIPKAPSKTAVKTEQVSLEGGKPSQEKPTPAISLPLKKAMDHIMSEAMAKAERGEINAVEYNNMLGEHVMVETSAQASAFIRRYKE